MLLLHYLMRVMPNPNQSIHIVHNVEVVEERQQPLSKTRILLTSYLLPVRMTHYCAFQVEVKFIGLKYMSYHKLAESHVANL